MKLFRYILFIIIIAFVVVILLINPFSLGKGLKGVIDPMGTGPTWVTAGAGRIFISDTVSSNIAVYETASGRYAGKVDNVPNVGYTYYSKVTKKLYAAAGKEGQGTLVVIDPDTLEKPYAVNLDIECRGMITSPDGKFIYGVWGGLKEGPGWITKTALKDYSVAGVGSTRESPTAILLSLDGKKAYVTSHFGQRNLAAWLGEYEGVAPMNSLVEVFDLTGDKEIKLQKEIEVGLKPQSMAAFGDGRYIMVASAAFENETTGLPNISIIDTRTDEVVKKIKTPGYAPFIIVASDKSGMAYSTFLYKVPVAVDDTQGISGEASAQPPEEPAPEGGKGKLKYAAMYGRGFLAIHLDDYKVDIYEDSRGLPLASLCLLDDGRIIGVSPEANTVVVIEPKSAKR